MTKYDLLGKDGLLFLLGNILKRFKDLAKVATTGKYTDLTGIPSSLPANGGRAEYVGLDTVIQNQVTTRAYVGDAGSNGSMYMQEDYDDECVRVGIDGMGPVGVNQAMKVGHDLIFTGAVTGSYNGSTAKLVSIPFGTNNLLATEEGTWLDATQGKVLKDSVDALNGRLMAQLLSIDDVVQSIESRFEIHSHTSSFYAYKAGNILHIHIVFFCKDGNFDNTRVCKLKILPPSVFTMFGAIGSSIWSWSSMAYIYVDTRGELIISDWNNTDKKYALVDIEYPVL